MWKYLLNPIFPVFLRLRAIDRVVKDRVVAALPQLRTAIADPNPWVRERACWAVRVFCDPEAIMPLLDQFSKGDPYHTKDALVAIGGSDVIDSMLSIVRDRESKLRLEAAYVLARVGDERAIEPILVLGKTYDGKGGWPDRRNELALLLEILLTRCAPSVSKETLDDLTKLMDVTETHRWQAPYEADAWEYGYASGMAEGEETKILVSYEKIREVAGAELDSREART